MDNEQLRLSFDHEAELYHAIRPRYPGELFERLSLIVALRPLSKIVEIGPGTGQATRSLAEKGYDITAVEIGAKLAKVASKELRAFKSARVVNSSFESASLDRDTYDLVIAATSFHWIDPEIRFKKSYDILNKSGKLAIIGTHHVSNEQGDAFFIASQEIYDSFYDNSERTKRLPPLSNDIHPLDYDNLLFKLIDFSRFPSTNVYSSKDYARLLNTYSSTLTLPTEKRRSFLEKFKTLIDEEFGGHVVSHSVASLTILAPLHDTNILV